MSRPARTHEKLRTVTRPMPISSFPDYHRYAPRGLQVLSAKEDGRLPVPPRRLPRGLGTMAFVASCFQVIEIESQVRSLVDRYLMVGMKVPFTSSECSAQFFQHLLCWRKPETDLSPDSY